MADFFDVTKVEQRPLTALDRMKLWVLSVVGLAECAVVVLSFTYIRPHWHATLQFSDWMD